MSGGCLEADLAEHAKQVHASHLARVVTYDTRADDDAAWGLGLGCNGLIDVFLEPLDPGEARDLARMLAGALTSRSPSVLATTIAGPNIGSHSLVTENVDDVFHEARRGVIRQNGEDTVALEVVRPSIKLTICGSGPDVVPLVRFSTQLGWDVTVVDHRPVESSHPERFPGAATMYDTPGAMSSAQCVVVMSHNYARDLEYVRTALGSKASYIGVLGPRARTERMMADMAASGEAIIDGDRLYGPIGLDIGADGPDAIALAIVAEVSAVMNARSGGHLRDRMQLHWALAQ